MAGKPSSTIFLIGVSEKWLGHPLQPSESVGNGWETHLLDRRSQWEMAGKPFSTIFLTEGVSRITPSLDSLPPLGSSPAHPRPGG